MRRGKLLAETTPNDLLARCATDSLEEAFLILSQQQNDTINCDVVQSQEVVNQIQNTDTNNHSNLSSQNDLRNSSSVRIIFFFFFYEIDFLQLIKKLL